jgi:hypothetical protein
MDRFMPSQPTGFDRVFRALGIVFATLRQCSWENYATYNQTFAALRPNRQLPVLERRSARKASVALRSAAHRFGNQPLLRGLVRLSST